MAFSPILIAVSVSLFVCRVVYCGRKMQDRPIEAIVCIEVEFECMDEISIGTILDALGLP